MAYAALVSLAQTLDQSHQISNDYQRSIFVDKKQQIMCIHEYVISLQAFLQDFPEEANSLEGRIRDVAYEAEDIVEYFMLPLILRRYVLIKTTHDRPKFKVEYHPRGKNKHKHLPYKFNELVEISKKMDELEKVTEKFESIAGEVTDFVRIKDDQQLGAAAASSILAPTHKHKDVMVGFDGDLMAIKARLCGESSQLQVIPIFGMGGIGKTTLARNAYDDPLTMEHFRIRAWVTVSQDYSAAEIASGLLDSMTEFNAEGCGQSTEEKVYKSLKGRRYLIVMDDVWSTKAWDDVRNIFPDDGNGSRIMLTTRLSDVAAYPASCSHFHEMPLMDADQSWNLLRHKVFAHQDCPPELENIGREIARSCKGLPLAIVVIAGLLSTASKTPASWGEIAANVTSAVATRDAHFERILSLSYTHLPHHLRPCFLYMGGFPEDYEIRASKLVKLWVAEGFLKRPNGSKSLEEEAEECLENLVKRSLVLVTKRKANGKIKSCSLHDLMRDLCIRKALE